MRVWFERGIVLGGKKERLLGCLVRGLVERWDVPSGGSTLQKHCRAACCFDCMIPRMWPCFHSMRPR